MAQQRVDTGFRTFVASAAIAEFLRVKLNSSGQLAVAGANDLGIGFTEDEAFAALDQVGVCLHSKQGTSWGLASGSITVGARVYPAAAGKVSASGSGMPIWIAGQTVGDGEIVELIPFHNPGVSAGIVAASTAIASTNVEAAFDQTVPIPANFLRAGDVLRVRALVSGIGVTATPTLTLKVKIGTVVVCTTGALTVAANDIGVIDIDIVLRTVGASGTVIAGGMFNLGVPGTASTKAVSAASAAIDTTAACDISVTATWSASSSSNTCRLDILDVTRVTA